MTHEVEIINQSWTLESKLRAPYCESFLCKLRGLTFRKQLPPERGLLLVISRDSKLDAAIHMLWMNFDIAVAWINSHLQVVDRRRAYRWRSFQVPSAPAKYILEYPIHRFEEIQIKDEILFKNLLAD